MRKQMRRRCRTKASKKNDKNEGGGGKKSGCQRAVSLALVRVAFYKSVEHQLVAKSSSDNVHPKGSKYEKKK